MALDHSLIGVPSEPHERSWTSMDALLYAVAVGAGLGDPLHELEFTTENSAGVEQKVLPTFGVHQLGPVERAQAAAGPGRRDEYAERRQHLLLDPGGVLGGELQFVQRIAQARADRDGVQQGVRRCPRALVRLAGNPDKAMVEWHGACLSQL